MPRRVVVTVHGIVQGVGFRPFVYRLAHEFGVLGDVRNVGGQVVARLQGDSAAIAGLVAALRESPPPSARVEGVDVAELLPDITLGPGFSVVDSTEQTVVSARVSPDLATCAACVRELFDPADRRYRYPFLSCTDCGPRATVIDALPYDRARTTMRIFPMCTSCAREYHDPDDRRFHAEPTACPRCGPRLSWLSDGLGREPTADAALAVACETVAAGGLIAVKGVGGYQLVCDAAAAETVQRLRKVKSRPTKPLAVMVRDLDAAQGIGRVDDAAAGLLTSPAAPIVLVPHRCAPLMNEIAPGVSTIGLFLPYSPLHHLLLAELNRPLVVTSGNRAGAPTVTSDSRSLRPLVDGILTHDRPIRARYDDSVLRVGAGRTTTVRRARGYAPGVLPLPVPAAVPLLAIGAQLKHTIAVGVSDSACVGPHTGDLADAETYAAFERAVTDLCRLHGVHPEIVAHDQHPGYLSTAYARRHWPAGRRVAVQHHHAHVAATAAEHRVADRFIGITLDGLGFGDDGTFWGGEVLLADYLGYTRFGRFATAPMPGGEAAVRHPARMALGYLFGAERFGTAPVPQIAATDLMDRMGRREVALIRTMIARNLNCPRASSAGRLFDALAALLGLCDDNSYEGEAAVRLESAAAGNSATEPLAWTLHRRGGLLVYDPVPTLRHAMELAAGHPAGTVAVRFHRAIAEVVVALATEAAAASGSRIVCLGGGVFQNALLTTLVLDGLAAAGLDAFAGEQVPMNDGGISYGQAAVASASTKGG